MTNERLVRTYSVEINDKFSFPVEYVQSPSKFFARCLYFSLKGFRSDSDALTRIIVSRSEIDLGDIKSEYEWLYDRQLAKAISVICSCLDGNGLIGMISIFSSK